MYVLEYAEQTGPMCFVFCRLNPSSEYSILLCTKRTFRLRLVLDSSHLFSPEFSRLRKTAIGRPGLNWPMSGLNQCPLSRIKEGLIKGWQIFKRVFDILRNSGLLHRVVSLPKISSKVWTFYEINKPLKICQNRKVAMSAKTTFKTWRQVYA